MLAQSNERLRWLVALLFAGLFVLQAIAFGLVIGLLWGESVAAWLPELVISSAFLLAGGVLILIVIAWQWRDLAGQIGRSASQDRRSLSMAQNQANVLKALAVAVGSTRDVDGLLNLALDTYQLLLNDFGFPADDQANAIYLLADNDLSAGDNDLSAGDNDLSADGSHLSVAAARGPAAPKGGTRLDRDQGVAARALAQAELLVSDGPSQDPALARESWLQDRQQVICVPLRTARGLYGLVMLALKRSISLSTEETGLLAAIADQVAARLDNFQLQQNLDLAEITHLTAEEKERRLVRQALHEGPSRGVAAVALRLALIRTMMIKSPSQAAQELAKMETQTRHSSHQLRNMIAYLRPLDLGVTNLDRAVAATLDKVEDHFGLDLRVSRRAAGQQLSSQARAVILYVVEGSLALAKTHGQATTAEINFWQEGDRFYVSIDDDGYDRAQGKPETVSRADDLATILMRAKVRRVGGRLDLRPKFGRGVSSLLTVPVDQQGPPPPA